MELNLYQYLKDRVVSKDVVNIIINMTHAPIYNPPPLNKYILGLYDNECEKSFENNIYQYGHRCRHKIHKHIGQFIDYMLSKVRTPQSVGLEYEYRMIKMQSQQIWETNERLKYRQLVLNENNLNFGTIAHKQYQMYIKYPKKFRYILELKQELLGLLLFGKISRNKAYTDRQYIYGQYKYFFQFGYDFKYKCYNFNISELRNSVLI